MNNSQRTKIIAEGIYLFSVVQDLPVSKVFGSDELLLWDNWAGAHPQFVEFVKREQFALFDLVNAVF